MIENLELQGILVVLKFHYGKRGSVNPIISKTMGKVAVISHAYRAQMPQNGSFWVCRIDKEISNPERKTGCFIVTPVQPVQIEDIKKLLPGTYDVEIRNNRVVCLPKVQGILWLMPFSIKKYYIKSDKAQVQYESIVVPLQSVEAVELAKKIPS